ncbi:MAG: hypothetical protein Q8P05_02435 [Candidatus Diapherotrites archaeon]|nr:hypothetical protein [Candidatus Diapherotrites archaeon]
MEKNEHGYQFHENWIQNVLKISNAIAQNYSRNEPLDFDKDVIQLHFTSWLNAGRFGSFTFKNEFPNPEHKPILSCWMHVWPVSTVSAEESRILLEQSKREKGLFCVCPNNTPLDQLFADWIGKLGRKHILGVDMKLDHDYVIKGDHIAQFYYPKSFLEKVDLFYRDNTDIKNIDYQKLQELATEKTNIHTIVIRNKELAEAKRNELLELFQNQ